MHWTAAIAVFDDSWTFREELLQEKNGIHSSGNNLITECFRVIEIDRLGFLNFSLLLFYCLPILSNVAFLQFNVFDR